MHLIIQQCDHLRRALGLSQAQLARRAGTAQGAVSQILQGSTDPRISTAQKLVRALETDYVISLRTPYGELPLTPGYGWSPLSGSHQCELTAYRLRFEYPSGSESIETYIANRPDQVQVVLRPCRARPIEDTYDQDLQQLVALFAIHQAAVAYAVREMQRQRI